MAKPSYHWYVLVRAAQYALYGDLPRSARPPIPERLMNTLANVYGREYWEAVQATYGPVRGLRFAYRQIVADLQRSRVVQELRNDLRWQFAALDSRWLSH